MFEAETLKSVLQDMIEFYSDCSSYPDIKYISVYSDKTEKEKFISASLAEEINFSLNEAIEFYRNRNEIEFYGLVRAAKEAVANL